MATQSLNPIIVRPQFNPKTSILKNLSDRDCFPVQVPENAFLSSGYCGILVNYFVLHHNLVPLPIQQMIL